MGDIDFRGVSVTGRNEEGEIVGTLTGDIVNNSEVGGYFEDIFLAPDTSIIGGEIRGEITGDADKPARLEEIKVRPGTKLDNVIITGSVELPEEVTLGSGVQFAIEEPVENFDSRGTSVSGRDKDGVIVGTLGGTVENSKGGGSVKDILLAANTSVSGVELGGEITGDADKPAVLKALTIQSGSVLKNVTIGENVKLSENVSLDNVILASNTIISGVELSGEITGNADKPAVLKNLTVQSGATLDNVIIGPGIELPEDVVLDAGVQIAAPASSIDSDGNFVETETYSVGSIRVAGKLQPKDNVVRLSKDATKDVQIKSRMIVDLKDIGQKADILVVANYNNFINGNFFFMLVDSEWKLWDGDMSNLEAAQAEVLAEDMEIPIFEGDLSGVPGDFTIYSGYRLEDGSVTYDGETPIEFSTY